MSTQTFHGSCQCGGVKFEADIDLSEAQSSKCNCTSCWKSRWWSLKVKPEAFRALGDGQLLETKRGFCRECGITPYRHVEKAEWNDAAYYSVNVAALDDLDPSALLKVPVQYCNGRDDDWWHAPAVTAHL